MSHQNKFVWFDLIRGISALLVCAGHLRAALIVDYTKVVHPIAVHKLLYFVTSLGHEAVMVFFVLSGFFVGGSVLRARGTFSWGQYAFGRLTRLWIVLIPTLLLTAMLDRWIGVLDPGVLAGDYRTLWNSGPATSGDFSDSLATFAGNVVFLQTITVPVFGLNGPLWSLSNEFWYYVVFPCLVCAFAPRLRGPWLYPRLLLGIAGFSLFLWLPGGIRNGFAVWILGVVIWLLRHVCAPKYPRICAAIGSALFLCALCYSKLPEWQGKLGISADLIVGAGFGVLAMSLVWNPVPASAPQIVRAVPRMLAAFSYSLYVVHFPVVILISIAFYHAKKMQPDVVGVGQFILWFCTLVVVGIVFWWCFEARTAAVRQFIRSRIKPDPERDGHT